MCGIFDPCGPFVKCEKAVKQSGWGDYEVSECGVDLQKVGGLHEELDRIARLTGFDNILSYDDVYAEIKTRQPHQSADDLKRQASRFMDETCRKIHKK